MPLEPGTTLVPYAVTAKIGEGGRAKGAGLGIMIGRYMRRFGGSYGR